MPSNEARGVIDGSIYFLLDGTRNITGRTTGIYTVAGASSARYGLDHTVTVTGSSTQTVGGLRIEETMASGQAASEFRGLYNSMVINGAAAYSYGVLSTVNHATASATDEAYGVYAIVGHSGAGLLGFNSGYSGYLTASGPTTINAGLYFETFNSAVNGTTYGLYATAANSGTVSGTLYGARIGATASGGTTANLVGLDVVLSGTGTTTTYGIRSNGDIILAGAQKLIGGTGTTSDLTLQTTSANAASGADMLFKTGNNGSITAMQINYLGKVGVNTAGGSGQFDVVTTSGTAVYGLAAASGAVSDVYGLQGIAQTSGSASAGFASGIYGQLIYSGSGNISNAAGVRMVAQMQGSAPNFATVSGLLINSFASVDSSGVYGIQIANSGNTGSGTLLSAYYGLSIGNITNGGTLTNTYGVHVGDLTTGTQTNTPYSFYASDSNTWNYFAGRVGIANTSPNNALDVTGTVQADGLRLDVTPVAETITPTHTITISVNGTNYRVPISI